MTIASSTSPPGEAGPSATSSGWIALVRGASWAAAGAAKSNPNTTKSPVHHSSFPRKREPSQTKKLGPRFRGDDEQGMITLGWLLAKHRLVEVRPQPARRHLDVDRAPLRIFAKLVLPDPRHAEIAGIEMGKVESRHCRSWQHREILGQRHFARRPAQHVEQHRFERMVRTGRIAGRRTNFVVALADQLLVGEMLVRIGPQPIADMRMKHFGKAFGEPVGQGLEQYVIIIIHGLLEPLEVRLQPVNPDRKSTDPVLAVRIDEVGQAHVGPSFPLLHLLAKEGNAGPVVAGKDQHIVAFAAATPQPYSSFRRHPALSDDLDRK